MRSQSAAKLRPEDAKTMGSTFDGVQNAGRNHFMNRRGTSTLPTITQRSM